MHLRLASRTKLFCPCPSEVGGAPNTHFCPTCAGWPGGLPVPQREAVRLALRLALAFGAGVELRSAWARKVYTYPDLPKGYQITQLDEPLARGGAVDFERDGEPRRVRLIRLHLEEDAGRTVTLPGAGGRIGLDYDRAGTPLVEIVTAPDVRDPAEAPRLVARLRSVARLLGVSTGDMEDGALRCDANVSVSSPGGPLGVRVEIKNLNSLRALRRALEVEIERQCGLVRRHERVVPETRRWDEASGATETLRGKETEAEYRYASEPDLPPLVADEELVREAADALPELPHARWRRLVEHRGVRPVDASHLADEPALADLVEALVEAGVPATAAVNWVAGELVGALREAGRGLEQARLRAADFASLALAVEAGSITRARAKERLAEAVSRGAPLAALTEADATLGEDAVRELVRSVVADHPDQARVYRAGKVELIEFFVGRAMRRADRRADPRRLRELLAEALEAGA
jgi:aspartyl-tRNA(Asn)/glutamyl-tRNA(Gln) amidotransferase subunit B